MSSNSALERMIDKVLVQKEAELISQIDSAYQESLDNLNLLEQVGSRTHKDSRGQKAG